MASFDIAWAKTAKHESANYDKSKSDTGNIYEGVIYGSKYGITALFLHKKIKLPLKSITPNLIENLTYDQAGQYAKRGVWDSIMQGDKFKNQEVANLVFDWLYQRYGTAIRLIGKVFYQSDSDIKYMINRLKFTDKLITDINNTNPAWAYVGIQQARYKFTTESGVYKDNLKGVKVRVQSYNAYTIKDCHFRNKVGKVLSKEDICADDSHLDAYFFGMPNENNNDWTTTLVWALGLYTAYRILK